MTYDFAAIEQRWQSYWAQHRTFATPNPGDEDFDASKPKYYVLDMFPYPSGASLHVGHPLGYITTDIVARYKRMCGYNVLHPMGYDSFGLPAEQFAIENNVHPRVTTQQNIETMTRQLRRLGFSYDWDRSLATTDPNYYRWTQWIFVQMYQSWFDPVQAEARPIAELERMLTSDQLYIRADGELISSPSAGLDSIAGEPIGAFRWHELSDPQRRQFLDNHRLAYLAEAPVNWCPALGTVLANEEITSEGRSERGNHPVFKRPLRQWMLRITAFAERLEKDLELLDWPESIKIMQRNWIGRSQGAVADFAVDGCDEVIRVYTTRPDTLFGATYMVLAPEHPLVDLVTTTSQRDAVQQYQRNTEIQSDVDRMADSRSKTGVFTGASAINPTNNEKIPIWVADYVMMGYGTGAIMAVPAHDQRDFEFAKQFGLPIRVVVMPGQSWLDERGVTVEAYEKEPSALSEAFISDGHNVNSANDQISLNRLGTSEAKQIMTDWLEAQDLGRSQVQYKLRDWLFSRQRYWGEPFPILHGPNGEVVTENESQLPVELPEMVDFKPQSNDDPEAPPHPPLATAPDNWLFVECNCGEPGTPAVRYKREVNTMPQWAGSCWYYLRFIDPRNQEQLVGKDAESYWMAAGSTDGTNDSGGVDLYVGGAEHAVLHLLYARFWHKVLYDLGCVSTPEPFARLFNQGYILAHAYRNAQGIYVPAAEVESRNGKFFHKGQPLQQEFGKMGKSLKNAITPDQICEQYGCDTIRLYEMYLGPIEQSKIWNTRDILGVHRFLQRLWRNFVDEQTGQLLVSDDDPPEHLERLLHQTIKRVTDDMERLSINTAIAALIELNNELVPLATIPRRVAQTMVLLLSPMAPHICEQLWHMLGHSKSLAYEPWPQHDQALLTEQQVEYPVQINGKLRSHITVAADAAQAAIEVSALANTKVQAVLEGKSVTKVIVIKGRMVNIVAR